VKRAVRLRLRRARSAVRRAGARQRRRRHDLRQRVRRRLRPTVRRLRRARARVAPAVRTFLGPLGPQLVWLPRVAVRGAGDVWRRGRRRWRRSMRIRVVATTMLLGLAVVLVIGEFLLVRIRDGLIDSRQAAVLQEAQRLTRAAVEQIQGSPYNTAGDDQDALISTVIASVQNLPGSDGRSVVLLRALNSTQPSVLKARTSAVPASAVPTSLRQAINRQDRFATELTSLSTPSGRRPVLIAGSVIQIPLSGPYELYYVFPLDREQQVLDMVQRTFLIGGIGLVLLVGGVAMVVTRQVVTPLRHAARTAEELASGRLDRRMRVRGQDDIARLGRAFNGMAASLERQIHQLEELSEVQRQFVSDVSHELRTPLTTIRMASEVIHEGRHDLDPVLARSAELLQTQIDRFDSLLADLLEISRFDAGAAALDLDTVDLRGVVDGVVEALAPLAERRGSPLLVSGPDPDARDADQVTAQVDPRRVERVVRNLIGNAIEHGEGRPIEVRLGASPDAVAVSVRDHGVGIDSAGLGMVFNRFWRGDPARARSTGGSGLGLAISLEDSHLHGGWLQAWGEPGRGAVFRLTLPRRVGSALIGSPLPLMPDDGDSADAADDLDGETDGERDDAAGPRADGPVSPATGLTRPASARQPGR
jgi:two-component system sensor histidine kinase MtrB